MKANKMCPHCKIDLSILYASHPEVPHFYALSSMKYDGNGHYSVDHSRNIYVSALACQTCGYMELESAVLAKKLDQSGKLL